MRLRNEDDLMSEEFRSMILKEINGPENVQRREDFKRSYDIFKDGTKKYVMDRLSKELGPETLEEMKNRTADISLLRKIIDKKAMVYREGVNRNCDDRDKQMQVDKLADLMNINSKMKKVNKYVELFKNCAVYVAPYSDPMTGKKNLVARVLPPYLYDVIEDHDNPEMPRVYIMSYFNENKAVRQGEPNESGKRNPSSMSTSLRDGDGRNQIIADSPDDMADDQEYVWWSSKYHFTTNSKGEIIPGKQAEDNMNPIERLPFENFSKDQDGAFWAIGGDDLPNGAILVNQLLSDLYFIAKLQGQGIFYLIGPKVPKSLKIGPSDAILMETKEGDPDTQIGFASSSPPIDSHMKMIEQYVALLLSTNNLEPGTVQGTLSATSAASGIQEMIRKSENMDDIEDQREIYRDGEPGLFDIIFRWHNICLDRDILHEDFKAIGKIPEDMSFVLKFVVGKAFMTDSEKLDIIQKRKDLGLDTEIDSLMRDNPDMTREEAESKLAEILEERLNKSRQRLMLMGGADAKDEKLSKEEDKEEASDDAKEEDKEEDES